MEIPDPVALPGETILVLNYRMRPALWEEGVLRSARFSPAYFAARLDGSTFHVPAWWHYKVFVKRSEQERGGYVLAVSDDGVLPLRAHP